jgi:hypothetical protein
MILPIVQLQNEALSITSGTDGHDFKEKISEAFAVGTFRIAPTPHETLSLDVHQTALNQDSGPHHPQDLDQMTITVEGSAVRNEAMLFEVTTKGIQMGGSFGHIRGCVDHRITLSFHCRKDSFALVEKRSIQKKILMCGEFDLFGGRMLKPILDDPSNGTHTVTALSCYLSHCVALNDPALKPNTSPQILVESVLPDKSATALLTQPALFVLPAFSVALNMN